MQTAVKWTIQEADSDTSPFPLPITLAVALQSAHCVGLLGCESYERPSRFEVTDARGEGGDPTPARLDAIAGRRLGGRLTGAAAPPRVGQTTLGGRGRTVRRCTRCWFAQRRGRPSPVGQRRRTRSPPPSPRTVNRTALFRIDLGL